MYIHLLADMSKALTVPLPCLCASFRRAARVLTQHYEAAHAATWPERHAIHSAAGVVPYRRSFPGQLGEILAIDSTTLTRTLAIMERRGWIASRPGKDRRERWLSLSKAGRAQYKRALPHWEKVQQELRAQFGNKRWNELFNLTNEVTAKVTE